MAHSHAIERATARAADPSVRAITPRDLRDALARGLDDFAANPTHAVFIGLIYPIVGLVLARLAFGYELLPLIYPLVAGFALLGPLAALGLYELSRRRERGLESNWSHAFDVVYSPSINAIGALGLVLMAIFLAWLATAQAMYEAAFGTAPPASVATFASDLFTTPAGWTLIVAGNAVGFVFAVVAFCISVVSFPLLLDRPVSALVAVRTSLRAVWASPGTMTLWAMIVAAGLVLGALPLFFGLAVTVPVLGHASWHLYRRAVRAPVR